MNRERKSSEEKKNIFSFFKTFFLSKMPSSKKFHKKFTDACPQLVHCLKSILAQAGVDVINKFQSSITMPTTLK